jgi:hypothetical protein
VVRAAIASSIRAMGSTIAKTGDSTNRDIGDSTNRDIILVKGRFELSLQD